MTEQNNQKNISRPPVVVIMGHVDHGKSSILEAIKDLKITNKESGGITQHIGAYEVEHQGKKITFIDTPGHKAFSAMRLRGSMMADIAILVIAGEEGIKPQTKEAILHIKKIGISLIVVINKIDKPESNPEKVKRELIKEGILVESMGGDIPSVNVSAKTKEGIEDLLEMILLVAEIKKVTENILINGNGIVIESYLDINRGSTATLLLKNGSLKAGDIIGTSSTFGKIKIIEDFQGNLVKKATPSMPISVIGFEEVPIIGEEFKVFNSIEDAKKNIKKATKKEREELNISNNEKVLNLILKVDVLGSIEAVKNILQEISIDFNNKLTNIGQEKITLNILKSDIGEINESDVKLAVISDAKIIGFRVKINKIAKKLLIREKITAVSFEIIYELAQAVRNLLEKKIIPKEVDVNIGEIKILSIFKTDKDKQIIGGKVIKGNIRQGALLKINRNGKEVGSGKIIEIQRDKKKVKQVEKGFECGLLYKGDKRIEEGDILNVYVKETERVKL